jgi:23S rRNA (guanosine2251-2'-O)-methyltransferase
LAILIGIHPITEALRAKRPLERILIARGAGGHRLQEIIDLARQAAIPVRFEDRGALDRAAAAKSHQGVVAYGAEKKYADFESIKSEAELLVVLDGVEDPHNLGAIIRTAHAAGANAIIIPERRAAGLTETTAKAAAGALEHLPVVQVVNINQSLRTLKEEGYFVYGLDEKGELPFDEIKWPERAVIVMGGEGKGLHDLVKRNCDALVRIPMAGKIASLNVSVATGIVLFSWRSSRNRARPAKVTSLEPSDR